MLPYRAAIFDFDFTLADASDGIVASYNHALRKAGYPERGREEIRRTVGIPVEDTMTLFTGVTDPQRLKEFRALFREKADEVMLKSTRMLPYAPELLRGLCSAGIKTGVVSTKARERIEATFAREGLLDAVGIVVGYEDAPHPKPAPDGIRAAMERLGAAAGETLYVGDHVVDAQAAAAAGVDFAAVLTGTTARVQFSPYPAKSICTDLREVARLIGL